MKTYSVLISQPAEILGRITVEASTEQEAISLVNEMVENDDYVDAVEWGETDYHLLAEVLGEVEEVEE